MNLTNCTAEAGVAGRPRSVTEKMLVCVALAVITALTTLLNSAVIMAICTSRRLHQPANYLVCSLAVTDLLVAVFVMPLSVVYIAMDGWGLGQLVCEVWLSVDMTCCTCSILHLCVIALDRYWAITDAVRYARKRTPRRAGVMILAVWAISVCIAAPPLFWRSRRRPGAAPSQCAIRHDRVLYTIYSTLGAFYIPLALILVLYYRIYHAAKSLYQKRGSSRHFGSRSADSQSSFASGKLAQTFCASGRSASGPAAGSERAQARVGIPASDDDPDGAGERQHISSARERKAARVLGLILGAFIFSWLPFFIKELIVGLSTYVVSAEVADFLTWLGYVNSLINPLLYTSFNEDFKLAFKKLIRCREHS